MAAGELWSFHTSPKCTEPFEEIDAIIGLGSYDETIVEHCVQLWQDRPKAYLIFTGKQGNWTTDLYKTTEAEHFANLAISQGVSKAQIIIEANATNISENIIFSEKLLPSSAKNVIYVTKPQTLMRLYATTEKISKRDSTFVSAPNRSMHNAIELFGREQIFSEMVGDLDRLISYPAKGFSIGVEVSDVVLTSWKTLQAAGFTSHMLKN